MKLICSLLAAAASLTPLAAGATRPHYGGTLRLEVRGVMNSFEMGPTTKGDNALLRDTVLTNVCDRLVTLDNFGEPQPSLAVGWRSDDARTSRFTIRGSVGLHNGGTLTPQMVVITLSGTNPDWRVRTEQNDVIIQSEIQLSNLLYQLAKTRNSICMTDDNGQWIGTGQFRISAFQPGQTIALRAFDDSWQGRPFVDEVRIQMGKALPDQAADLQLGKADLVESDFTQLFGGNSVNPSYTRAIELFALTFSRSHLASSNAKLREALADSVDRSAIYSVLLRRLGEPSGGLLPEWISGYAHLFTTSQDLAVARQARTQSDWTASLALAYDGNDPLAKLIAERVAVNANEAGISIQPRPESPAFRGFDAELRLVRVRIESPDRVAALSQIGDMLDIGALRKSASASSADALYGFEREAVNEHSVIPLAYVPESFVSGRNVHDFAATPWGEINLGNVWMETSK